MKCTFFDYEMLKDIIGALIGTLTALGIYFLTIRHDKKNERDREKKVQIDKLNYLENLIESFINGIDSLNQSLKDLIENFEKDIITFHPPVMAVNESAPILEEYLKSEELFIAYSELLGTEKIKNFNNLRNESSFFLFQKNQIDDMNARAKNFDFERKKEMSQLVDTIMADLTRIYDLPDEDFSQNFKIDLFEFSKEFESNLSDRSDVKIYNDRYLIPLMDKLLPYVHKEYIFQIISRIKKARILFAHIESNNFQHLENLKQIQLKVNDLKKKVINNSEFLKTRKYI
jgi:hypothetical protein